MARTTEQEVREIMDADVTDDELTPFLDAAESVVDGRLVNEGYTDEELGQIAKWLSAHFASAKDPGISQERLGDAEVRYEGKFGTGLRLSRYGQMVMLIEHKGILASIDASSGPAEVVVIA